MWGALTDPELHCMGQLVDLEVGWESLVVCVKCGAGGFAGVEGLTNLLELGEVGINDGRISLLEILDETTVAGVVGSNNREQGGEV